MSHTPEEYPELIDLDNCAKEPIHIIGKSQAHGVLLACDPLKMTVTQAGENTAEFFGIPVDELLGQPLENLLGREQVKELQLQKSEAEELPQEVTINGNRFLVLSHFSGPNLVLDFEPLTEVQDSFSFQKQLTEILNRFQKASSLAELSAEAAQLTRKIFGYDRVMIYRFDEDWNGEVIAESKKAGMEPWLGLHYPATDIPEQSRKLFLTHPVRIITDVHYTPVPLQPQISPLTGEPLDISRSGLRAVSPIHIEYLKNMGVGASLSAAVIVKGKLWGLIACHHNAKKYLDFYQRESCRFLAQMFTTGINLHVTNALLDRSGQLESIRRRLMTQMNYQSDILKALNRDVVKFTDLMECEGGAIRYMGQWELSGRTPSVEELDILLNKFIKKQPKSLFSTPNLPGLFPEAISYKDKASGILSLKISEDKFVFWFKPEVVGEVHWGGNPQQKAFYNEEKQRLSPRKSFEKWSEKVTGFSEAWKELDLNTARSFRENISHVLLARQRREIEALNDKLIAANKELELFSYGLSHDLRAPVRGLEGFLDILQEDHTENLDEDGQQLLKMSKGLTQRMNSLIDDILEYSKLGNAAEIKKNKVNTSRMVRDVLDIFHLEANFPNARIEIQEDLPLMTGDRRMLFQLWANLLNNALKYSSEKEEPVIEVGTREFRGREVFFIKDNGIGIRPEFRKMIFETFKRAVGSRFQGTGIGLAIVKRIVEKHQGEVWVESTPGEGSVFYFYLGLSKEENI